MSEWNAYIVPMDDRTCRGQGPAILNFLEDVGFIDGFDDEEFGWYAGGDGKAFPNVRFEYVEIYDSEAYHFIPSCTTGGYGATCPHCKFALDETLHELRDDWPESHEKKDMAKIKVPCPSCGQAAALRDLHFEIDTAMTRVFVMLANGEPSEWDANFIPELERVLGCKTRIVMERM